MRITLFILLLLLSSLMLYALKLIEFPLQYNFTFLSCYYTFFIGIQIYLPKYIEAMNRPKPISPPPRKEIREEYLIENLMNRSKCNPKENVIDNNEDYLEDVYIDLDEERKIHWDNKLNKHEIQYLLNEGYIIRSLTNPYKKKKEKFVIKTNGHESLMHGFVMQLTWYYLKDYVEDLNRWDTVKPDLTFIHNGKKWAIEIETGKNLMHNKKQLLKKIELLKKNYDRWFFIVTNRNLASKYKKLGEAYDLRYIGKKLRKEFGVSIS